TSSPYGKTTRRCAARKERKLERSLEDSHAGATVPRLCLPRRAPRRGPDKRRRRHPHSDEQVRRFFFRLLQNGQKPLVGLTQQIPSESLRHSRQARLAWVARLAFSYALRAR